jgi:hypothetical protein
MENQCSVAEASQILGVSKPAIINFISQRELTEIGRIAQTIILDRQQVERLKVKREGRFVR